MSFDRNRAQVVCENLVGCTCFDDFFTKSHNDIENLTLDNNSATTLKNSLIEDSKDLYFKGCLSFSKSLNDFGNRDYSWAIIQAYYSIFYFIKADLAIREYALIRHKSIYYLKASVGSRPVTKGRNGSRRTEYSGDHKSAINYYNDLFSTSDMLLTEDIEGLNAYHWLMKKREQVNYQERYFCEPGRSNFLEHIDNMITAGKYEEMINDLITDQYLLTFQPEFASLAIPIKRLLQTKQNFNSNGVTNILRQDQINYLKSFDFYAFYL